METISQILEPQYLWIIVGFILVLLEFALPGLMLLFFGMGAILVGLLCWMFNFSLNIQLLLFIIASIVFLITLKNSFKKFFQNKLSYENSSLDFDEFVGQKAEVVTDIPVAGVGKVEFRGTRWEAEASEAIERGSMVEITGKDNITLTVKKI